MQKFINLSAAQIATIENVFNMVIEHENEGDYDFTVENAQNWELVLYCVKPKNFMELWELNDEYIPYYNMDISCKNGCVSVENICLDAGNYTLKNIEQFIAEQQMPDSIAALFKASYLPGHKEYFSAKERCAKLESLAA